MNGGTRRDELDLLDRLAAYSRHLHARGRACTARGSTTEGVAFRRAANELRGLIGLVSLDYDGNPLERSDTPVEGPTDDAERF